MLKLTVLITYLLFSTVGWSAETCSRIASVNYQDVLVDVSSNKKGEGLRYYLEKDEVAKDLLNEYQENNKSTWQKAAMSTLGTGMILAGFMRTDSGGNGSLTGKNFLLFGGAALITISYLISKTNSHNNEYLLSKSIEEYNKRNTPKIFFSPTDPKNGMGLGVGVGQEF